jgi:hypothetical protein
MWNMIDDPVEEIARGAARRLASQHGIRLETDVEAALYARHTRGLESYDPVAIASLVVSVAQLAWMIYSDHRKKAPEVVERTLRTELRRQVEITPNSAQITDVIVHEIIQRMPEDLDP